MAPGGTGPLMHQRLGEFAYGRQNLSPQLPGAMNGSPTEKRIPVSIFQSNPSIIP